MVSSLARDPARWCAGLVPKREMGDDHLHIMRALVYSMGTVPPVYLLYLLDIEDPNMGQATGAFHHGLFLIRFKLYSAIFDCAQCVGE